MAVIEINKEQFEKLISADKPLLVDFWAPWCTYCQRIEPAYEQIGEEYSDRLMVAKVNIDAQPQIAGEYKIELIPTIALFNKGNLLGTVAAPQSRAAIAKFIDDTLAK